MHSSNPFLRAFFRSTLPAQCNPVHQHILLVPTTEVLLTSKDGDTNTPFADLAASEDFLGSHVLRLSGPQSSGINNAVGSKRDSRGKARQFNTVNGRTLVVKESFVYSNKGFRNLNQAQLLTDALYYHDSLDAQQWLIYYISKPLVGAFEPIKVTIASLPKLQDGIKSPTPTQRPVNGSTFEGSSPTSEHSKRDVKSFNDLLNSFPMVARQMQPGLEKVFNEFKKELDKPLPSTPSRSSTISSRRTSSASTQSNGESTLYSKYSNGHPKSPSVATTYAYDEEDHMRRALETAVTAAIDLFQLVDKQQLSLLGATTDLTGPLVERLIERYITEQVHDSTLFPRLCSSRKLEDLELESRIHQMSYIDIAQVGIEIEGGRGGKEEFMKRLSRGVEEFRRLGVAGSPQEMLNILLATQKTITTASTATVTAMTKSSSLEAAAISEKPDSMMVMNADTLVSLLLVVVIRSQVRHLHARLVYMQNFIFIDDVEGGELGYALSTFEGVLSYLATDSGGLRKSSRRNKRLWQATKRGNVAEMKVILEPDHGSSTEDFRYHDEQESDEGNMSSHEDDDSRLDGHLKTAKEDSAQKPSTSGPNLAHVFPFQAMSLDSTSYERPRPVKRVSMDLRSLSNSSEFSFKSRTTTIDSRTSGIEGDTSIEKLCQTQDSSGESVPMMAIEARQPEALTYLLSLDEHYPTEIILQDCNSEGTTLLSAAVQLAHTELMEILLHHIFQVREGWKIQEYFEKQDLRGRTVGHYLFNAPHLIPRYGDIIPWRRKDKNGQTPLLALCRSYDHPHYLEMVNEALQYATNAQLDGQRLHLDDHVDMKSNTLLHAVNDPYLALRILQHCDADPNAGNDKRFTPLMVASKYGRFDMVRAMFLDNRVDISTKEHRGMTAVELAKDDDVRNRIDDMILVSNAPAVDGRVTAVVRSFFVEDATMRLIIKSATRNGEGMIAVTTCRRSLADFENLAKWLSVEHPASWLPSIFNFRTPFQIPSRPARAVLQDVQVRLDKFLRIMLAHSTFSTHELLWEFILVPEIQPEMMAERSRKKAEIRAERVRDEYEPVEDVKDIETFVSHARETIRGVNHSTKSVIRRTNSIRNVSSDFATALDLSSKALSTCSFLPPTHIDAFAQYATTFQIPESDPYNLFHQDLQAISSTILAILSSLSRPHALVSSLQSTQKSIERHTSSLRRSDRWPLGLLDETRKGIHLDAQEKVEKAKEELRTIGCELSYTQQTVAGELAEWQSLHAKMAKRAIRTMVESMVIKEKCRLEGMKRAVRGVPDIRQ